MNPIINSVPQVLALVRKQIQGLKELPGLDKVLPYPRAKMEATRDAVLALEERQAAAQKEAALVTELLLEAAFRAREQARENIAFAVSRLGRYSPDLSLIGGAPLMGHRGSAAHGEIAPGAPPARTATPEPPAHTV